MKQSGNTMLSWTWTRKWALVLKTRSAARVEHITQVGSRAWTAYNLTNSPRNDNLIDAFKLAQERPSCTQPWLISWRYILFQKNNAEVASTPPNFEIWNICLNPSLVSVALILKWLQGQPFGRTKQLSRQGTRDLTHRCQMLGQQMLGQCSVVETKALCNHQV